MKNSVVLCTLAATALFCAAPLSIQYAPNSGGPLSLRLGNAAAAEMDIPAQRVGSRRVRYGSYYRERSYDLYCGGPYVGGGWNGGTYYGGPWMDLRCYGAVVEPVVNVEQVVRVKG